MDEKNIINSVFILGSTSEVAQEICLELANKGCKIFHFVYRDKDKNNSFVSNLKKLYSTVVITSEFNDLNDTETLYEKNNYVVGDYDLYLITAGTLGDNKLARYSVYEALKINTINFSGIIPWLTAIMSKKRINEPRRLWVFSSVAADRGRPSNYHYGAAKAGLNNFCEGLLYRCYKKPFSVRIIKPGYLLTKMTIGKAPKFLCTSPKVIARELVKSPNKRGIHYMPWWWGSIMFFIRKSPAFLISKI